MTNRKRRELRERLRRASSLLRDVLRTLNAHLAEVKTIGRLTDYEVEPRELRDILDDVASAEADFDENVEQNLDKLVFLFQSGRRNRRTVDEATRQRSSSKRNTVSARNSRGRG